MNIFNTKWAKDLKKHNPSVYKEAMELAANKNIVFDLYYNNDSGDFLYSIDYKGFWMDSFKTKKEALFLCKKMGWKINKTKKSI